VNRSLISISFATFLCLVLLLTSGCSPRKSPEAQAGVRFTVLTVVDKYLRTIASGDSRAADQMVAWNRYSEGAGPAKTRTNVLEKIDTFKGRWNSKEENPLLGLDMLAFDVDENEAEISLVKPISSAERQAPLAKNQNREINIELVWGGSSWLIAEDNLFGNQGYLSE